MGTDEAGPVIRLSGEADLTNAGQVRDALTAQLSAGVQHITVEMSGLRFADTASIRVLIQAHRALRDRGGALELLQPQMAVAKSLSLLGVDKVIRIRTQA